MTRYYLTFILVLALDVTNSLTARYAFNNGSRLFLILSILSIMIAGYFFIRLMDKKVGIVVNATWIALGTASVTVATFLVYNERLIVFQGLGMGEIVFGVVIRDLSVPPE